MTRLYVWWFDGLWRHTVCHNPTTASLLDRMLQAAGHTTQIIERRTTMSYSRFDPYSQTGQDALAWRAIANHPLIGDLPSLPERGTYAESVRARLDEIAAASLPEPDATNPDHWRFAANLIPGNWRLRSNDRAITSIFNEKADALDAARTVEREREQRIEQAAGAINNAYRTTPWNDSASVAAALALDAAGLLRGGGRGE